MRVALFGGTFDPPHRGHLAVALAAAQKFSLDTVLFAPTARQPLKPSGATATFDQRLAMVTLLCGAAKTGTSTRLIASILDAPRQDGRPNYTIDTIESLRAQLDDQHPDTHSTEVFVIVGADSFIDLRRWRQPDALLAAAEWIVVSRPGFSLTGLTLTPEQQQHVHILDDVNVPATSTKIREALRTGADTSAFLTPEVSLYIRDHGLYDSPAGTRNTP